MTAGAMPRSSLAFKLLVVFISAIVVIAIFYALNVWLNWTVFQYMYSIRQGLTGPALYFITAIRLWWLRFLPCWSLTQSLGIAINLLLSLHSVQGLGKCQGTQGSGLAGLPIFGNITMPALMMTEGYGSWSQVLRIMALPFDFAPAQQIIALIPTMQIQYFLIYSVLGGILVILMVRLVIRAIRDFAKSAGNNWIRDIVLFFSCLLGIFILGAPYWLMNAASPYAYGTLWCLLLFTFVGWLYLKLSGKGVI